MSIWTKTRRETAAFGWILLVLGCASDDSAESGETSAESAESGDTAGEPTPQDMLDACELPEPCTTWTDFDFCDSNGPNYEPHDVCTFEALLAEPPNVVRASTRGPACTDVSESNRLDIYRWADGSMTCVLAHFVTDGIGGHSSTFDVVDCTLPDTTTIEACLADAQAGLEVSETCLAYTNWGLELGAAVEPTCKP